MPFPVKPVSSEAFVDSVGAFVNANTVGLPVVGEADKFFPLPDTVRQLVERIQELEARVAHLEGKR
jgi:hypothetical protein